MNEFIVKMFIYNIVFLILLFVISIADYNSSTSLVKGVYGIQVPPGDEVTFEFVSIGKITIELENKNPGRIYDVHISSDGDAIIAEPADMKKPDPGDVITWKINDKGCTRGPLPIKVDKSPVIVTADQIEKCINQAKKEKAETAAEAKEKAAAEAKEKAAAAEAAKNKPPIIKIPPQLTMNENTKKTIAPTTFTDENPNQVTFLWEQIAGDAKLNLAPNNQKQVTLTAPEILPPNKFGSVKLTANDGKNPPVGSNQLQVTILNVNKPPIINISKIGPVLENKSVVLDATGTSDPDRDQPLRFSWNQITKIPKAVMKNNLTSSLTFIAPNVHNDTKLQLQLTVSDGNKINGTAKRTLIIPVKQVNLPPVADAGKNFVANESSIVTLNGNKTKDPDKFDKLKYLWTQVAGELFIDIKNEKTVKPSFKVPFVKQNNSLYTFKLTVTDPKGLNSSDTVNMTVRKISNITVNPPTAQVAQNLTVVQEGANTTLNAANSTDPDVKETLTFQWKQIAGQPQVELRDVNKAVAKFRAPVVEENTTLTFNVTATNKKGLKDTATTFVKIANIPERFPIMNVIIAGVGAAGAASAAIIYKFFFMRKPSGPGRAI